MQVKFFLLEIKIILSKINPCLNILSHAKFRNGDYKVKAIMTNNTNNKSGQSGTLDQLII